MEHLVAWCGFVGAWLLVAGPLAQGTIELEEEQLERDVLAQATAAVAKPSPVSAWWWLVPPARYLLNRARTREYRRAVAQALSPAQLEAIHGYLEKAQAWLLVAGGAALFAVKETWQLRESYQWAALVFWLLVAAMLAACIVSTVLRVQARNGRASQTTV